MFGSSVFYRARRLALLLGTCGLLSACDSGSGALPAPVPSPSPTPTPPPAPSPTPTPTPTPTNIDLTKLLYDQKFTTAATALQYRRDGGGLIIDRQQAPAIGGWFGYVATQAAFTYQLQNSL